MLSAPPARRGRCDQAGAAASRSRRAFTIRKSLERGAAGAAPVEGAAAGRSAWIGEIAATVDRASALEGGAAELALEGGDAELAAVLGALEGGLAVVVEGVSAGRGRPRTRENSEIAASASGRISLPAIGRRVRHARRAKSTREPRAARTSRPIDMAIPRAARGAAVRGTGRILHRRARDVRRAPDE